MKACLRSRLRGEGNKKTRRKGGGQTSKTISCVKKPSAVNPLPSSPHLCSVVELVFQDGRWQTLDDITSLPPMTSAVSSAAEISGLSSIRRFGLRPSATLRTGKGSVNGGDGEGDVSRSGGSGTSGTSNASPVKRSASRMTPLPSLREEAEEQKPKA